MTAQTKTLFWLAGLIMLSALTILRWPDSGWLKTDVFALLPPAADQYWQQQAITQRSRDYNRKLVLAIDGEPEQAQHLLSQIQTELERAGYLATASEDQETSRWQAAIASLHPYRRGLLHNSDRQQLAEEPQALLTRWRAYLYSPLGSSAVNNLADDPIGSFQRFAEAALPPAPAVSNTDKTILLHILNLKEGAISLARLKALYQLYLGWKEQAADSGLGIYASGAALYTAFGASSGNREISTIGTVSLLTLSLLLVLTLRSVRSLILTLLCIGSGLICGVLSTLISLQQIHLLTLVFGATLIGIAADYALHYLSHSLTPGWQAGQGLVKVWRSLTLSALSSALAFIVLALLPFPGLRQIGIFMAAGLLGSYATVALLFPGFYHGLKQAPGLPAFCHYQPVRQYSTGICAAILLLSLPGLLLLQPRDDIRDFYARPANLTADEAFIRSLGNTGDSSRFLLIKARSIASLLSMEEALNDDAIALGIELALTSQRIPSPERQRQNAQLLRQLADSGLLYQHLTELGFSEQVTRSISTQMTANFEPLSATGQIAAAPLPGSGGVLGCDQHGCASYALIRGQVEAATLTRLLATHPHVHLVDQVADINHLLASYRQWVTVLLFAGAIATMLLLCAATSWRHGITIMALPLLTCLSTFGLNAYFIGSYSIIDLLALLLIIGVSLDYAVFRSLTPPQEQAATTLAITLSALTSILAFGMLAFSATPLISAFGRTIATGLVLAWLLSWLLPMRPGEKVI
ncbi:MAG: MMPL family transporter [Parahaliea sp.]